MRFLEKIRKPLVTSHSKKVLINALVFLTKPQKSNIWAIFGLFRSFWHAKAFFKRIMSMFLLYTLISCKKSEKTDEPLLRFCIANRRMYKPKLTLPLAWVLINQVHTSSLLLWTLEYSQKLHLRCLTEFWLHLLQWFQWKTLFNFLISTLIPVWLCHNFSTYILQIFVDWVFNWKVLYLETHFQNLTWYNFGKINPF